MRVMTGPALRRAGLWEALIRTTRKPFLRHVLGPVPSTPRDPSSDTHSLPLDTESPWLPQETPPDEGQSWAALCPNSWHPQGQGVLPTAWGGGHGKPECFLRTAQGPTVWSRAAGSRGMVAVVEVWGGPRGRRPCARARRAATGGEGRGIASQLPRAMSIPW